MAPIFYKSILAAITLLFVELSIAEKSCHASCSTKTTVQLGSGFLVSCTFFPRCADRPKRILADSVEQTAEYNSMTIFLNVTNITKDTTYTCSCDAKNAEPCGLDVITGYPPDAPQNVTCIQTGEQGVVVCTWQRGRETHIVSTSELRVTNGTNKPVIYQGSTSVPGVVSAQFRVNGSVQCVFSVWVLASNDLGSAKSPTLNFTLSDIVRPFPPEPAQIVCSSRDCNVTVAGRQGFQLLEGQHRPHGGPWITHPQTYPALSVFSLEPFRRYEFRVRSRFRRRGQWSEWSRTVSNWTQEEAPVKAVDLWYTRPSSTSAANNSVTFHWKELNDSEARGRILAYEVKVRDILTKNVTSTNRHTVLSCVSCEVTVFALNSKGCSPPARVTIPRAKAQPPQNVTCKPVSNHSVAISWRRPVSAEAVTGYLLEWYPVGRQVEELRWVRLGPEELHTVITDNIEPYECYEGAVSALYEEAVGRAEFDGVSTSESVPTEGPSVHLDDKVTEWMTEWTEVPAGHRGGCVISYSVHVENVGGSSKVPPHRQTARVKRAYTLKSLPPADTSYLLWITAWTASGEGPPGNKVPVFIPSHQGSPTIPVVNLIIILVVSVTMVSLCLQIRALRQRVFILFRCLVLDIVPDPANSKWAKECAKEGEIKLYLSDSSVSEEEEPHTVEVQELPKESWGPGNPARRSGTSGPTDIPSYHRSHSLSPVTGGTSLLYPKPVQSSYIKSFSQESDSSEQTQSSKDTEVTVDYISTHMLGTGEEEEEEEEEEEDGLDVLGFFPCAQNTFMDPLLSFGGKLTLDAVRIDCSEFLN